MPWAGMKRVEKDGNIMVEIPNFWYKREILKSEPNPNGDLGVQVLKERRIISPVPLNGYKPMFDYADGVRDKVYIGAYEGSLSEDETRLLSVPNAKVAGGKTRTDCRTLARANGEGYQQQDYIITSALQWLFLVEYASFDSRRCLGLGHSNGGWNGQDIGLNTGLTESLGDKSGQSDGVNGRNSISYRGIENLWGNYWQWVDGLSVNSDTSVFCWTNNPSKYSDTIDDYEQGFCIPRAEGWIKKFGSINNDFGFMASELNGSYEKVPNNRYSGANFTANKSVFARIGGGWNNSTTTSLFFWYFSFEESTIVATARLAYI